MASFSIRVLDTDLVFSTDASPGQVEKARKLVEEKYTSLGLQNFRSTIGREKLMLSLALSLADDLIQMNEQLERLVKELEEYNKRLKK